MAETVDDLVSGTVAELRAARRERREARRAVEAVGEDQVAAVADAVDRATALLDSYEDRATGTGDFQAFIEFQERFVALVEDLPADLPEHEAFEAANERLDRRRLSERHFERARADLEPAVEVAGLLDERAAAEERYGDVRHDARARLDELDARIEDLERLQRLGDADLEAPVEDLREPVERYNDAVREAFRSHRSSASARELLGFVETAAGYPLVEYREPPADLLSYVRETPAGREPVPKLLEYADYSDSKLDHYVADPGALRTNVAVHRTYLERLDATPLTVSWPPAPATRLRFRLRELTSVVGRFAPEETVALLRELREATREGEYRRLREAAVARDALTDAERRRLESGGVEAELASVRDARERLEDALGD